ncbi:MAG: carbonic anhydrase/acetyltransferase-like protein (isoleucine patch superfamily) [Limisphaerales bacterium]|jgi:carbonic anhydrase/acetyltransferase-like protein (isoleucine patch superfamily)
MALLLPVEGKMPQFGSDCFLAPNATIVGDVKMGDNCSVWFNAVVRGDVNAIKIGNKVNIQDGAVIHCTFEKAATEIGNSVSIGHNAIVHGCTLKDHVLIGMGAIVMDNAVINENALIAAGAVVLEGTIIESGTIWAGVPAKKVKTLPASQFADLNQRIADNYVRYSSWFK